jgi:hypothetical protein
LAVNETTWTLDSTASTKAVSVTANTAWTVTSNQTWLTTSVVGGNGKIGRAHV